MSKQVISRCGKRITVAELGNMASGSSTRPAGFQPATSNTSGSTAPSNADESSDEAPGVFPTDSQPVTPGDLTPTSTSEVETPEHTSELTPSTFASPEASQLGDSFDLGDIFWDIFNAIEAASQPAPHISHESVPLRLQRIGLFGSTGLYSAQGLGADIPTVFADLPPLPTYPFTRHTTFNAAETRGVVATPRSPSEFNSNYTTAWVSAQSPPQKTRRTLGSIGNSGLYSTRGPEAEISGRDVGRVAGLTNRIAYLAEERAEQEAKKQLSLPECAIQRCHACQFFEMVTKGMLSNTVSGLNLWGSLHKLQASPHARWMLVESDSLLGFLRLLKKQALLYPVDFERTFIVLEIICQRVHEKSLYTLVSGKEDDDEWLCYGGPLDFTFQGFPGEPGW